MANRQQAVKMADRGATAKEIRQATGVTAQAARNIVSRASTPAPSPVQAAQAPAPSKPAQPVSVQQISKQNTLNQNLRAASGVNGVLSEKELLKISKVSGKDNEKVLEKAVGKGLMIGSKVVNQYQKGKYSDPGLVSARQMLPGFAMAAGKDSAILQQLRNAGRQDKGSALFIGSKGSTATTLPRKMGLGVGAGTQPVPTTPATPQEPVSTGEQPIEPIMPFIPEELPEEPQDPGAGMLSGGGMGAAGANKLGRAKSRLRQLGIYGRGTGLLNRGLQYGNALNK